MEKQGKRFHDSNDEPTKVMIKEKQVNAKEIPNEKAEHSDQKSDRDLKRDQRLKEKNSKKLEKMLSKKKKREAKSKRSVLSYEDMPLQEREGKKKFSVKLNKRRIVLAVIVLLIVFALVFFFSNSDKLSWHNISNFVQYGVFNMNSDQSFPMSIQGESITAGNFVRMGQDICYASDTKVQMLNNYGKIMMTSQHSFTSPVLVTSHDYSLVYNLGGKGFQINSREENLYTGTAEENILVADINDNGTYALVTQSDGYLSKLYVYDQDHKQIYAYSFASYYITSVSLNSNGRCAVASGISAHNGTEFSCVYVLDFTKDTPVYMQEYEDGVIYVVEYLNDTRACAIGNSCVSVINTRNGEAKTTEYEGKTLTAFTVNNDTDTLTVSLSRSGDGRNCEILSFGTSGNLTDSFTINDRVIALSTYKNRVAVLSPDTVYLYNKSGSLLSKKEPGNEPYAIELYTTSDAYILNTSEISTISL